MKITISIKDGDKLEAESENSLLKSLLDHGEFVDNACNGKATCGKCKVRVLKGDCGDVSEEERVLLKTEEIDSGVRLSCIVFPKGDVEVELLQKKLEHKVLTTGKMPEFVRDNLREGYGFAIDIGTTTVVCTLVDLSTGEELASASDINAQKIYGLDVLTRITYEYEHPETAIKDLQVAIVDSLNAMMKEACKKAHVARSKVSSIAVAANCTMMHMLLGVDARSIGKAPYIPEFTSAQTLKAGDIGLLPTEAELYCLPQVSGYIGADIVAGAYVCEMQKSTQNELFIDIGTNGEIVLAKNGELFSCSCAAGPALEGMNISCGMRAAEGAIEDIVVEPVGIRLATIANKAPEGICGSGILAAIRELVRTGIVTRRGVFLKLEQMEDDDWRKKYVRVNESNKRELVLCQDPEMVVTQSDVRQVQMAKGAILSGFTALLNTAEIDMDALDKVYVAGQFGAHLPVESLVGSGILPKSVEDKIVYVGNSSKTGAYMTLISNTAKKEIEQLAKDITYVELSLTENYDRIFSECMMFPDCE